MKKKIILAIGIVLLLISIGAGLYPTVSNLINTATSRSTIDKYSDTVNTLSEASRDEIYRGAEEYNENLKGESNGFDFVNMTPQENYDNVLNFGNGVIGYIEIPKIDCYLPVYHGTNEHGLSMGAVHLPNTAFPIGGKGNHSILAGHTAYIGKIFFDNIDKLKPGDIIYIKILDYAYAYKVVETNIVEPHDISKCQPVIDKELLSLVTCYPYAQNTHRLIVLAERDTLEEANVNADESGSTNVR